ncbi:DUF6233 domain-containing protein [Streptomyces tauricus]|uniref:DUF6233 domain-containing protein n=1 Tax=Streptomyces tauricus TaxID=68274 RepID=UPI003815E832
MLCTLLAPYCATSTASGCSPARQSGQSVVVTGPCRLQRGNHAVEVHTGHCYAIGKRRRPISRDEARRLLDAGLRACSRCTPDTLLDIPLSSRPALAAAAR